MRLHRNEPPLSDFGVAVAIGSHNGETVFLNIELREIDHVDEFFPAFAKSCARIWGEYWHAGLERAAGVRKGTAAQWMKRGRIPPPVLVAWVAYITARPDARAIGWFLNGLAETEAPEASFAVAVQAFEGMNR